MTTAVPRTAHRSPARSRARARDRGRARTALLAVLLAAFGLLGQFGGAAPAGAHALLTDSDPAEGEVVTHAPEEVTLTFTENVALSGDSIRVLAPDGKRVDDGEPGERSGSDGAGAGEGFHYAVGLRDGLADGTYTVAWRVVSADSHPIAGGFTFSVGAPSETSVSLSAEQPGGGLVGALYDIARYAAYTGYVLLVGGAVFVLACWPGAARLRAVQRLVVGGWLALTAATIAALLLRGPYTGSGRLGDALDADGLRAVLETRPGTALVSRLLLLAVAALFVSVLFGMYARLVADGAGDTGEAPGEEDTGEGRGPRDRRELLLGLAVGGAVGAVGLAATWALAEHASTGIQTGVAIPADILHLLAVAVWLGGLAALLTALWRGPAVPAGAVRRFSGLALGSVAVLAATGLYQSWRQVGSWSALTSTDYGRLLLVKVGLVALLVALARYSRRWTARLADTAPAAAADTTDTADTADTEPGAAAETETGTEGKKETASASAPAEARSERRETAPAVAGATTTAAASAPERANGDGPGGPEDAPTAERAAQLARQRAAADAARRRRERDADLPRTGLRRSVLAEAAVAVAVLAVTTLLTGTEPARTTQAAASAREAAEHSAVGSGTLTLLTPFDTGGQDGKGSAELEIDPGRKGDNTVRLLITGPDGRQPMDVPEVRLAFTLEAQDIGPLTAELTEDGTGRWTATGLQLPMSGVWEAAVTVRTSDIDQVTERMTFFLP
ncbi:copper resistance protein CopC [Streptomyces sp. TRM 70361]|uniref:copper resistance CopC/CopD family protein n=1 Tax=Streptomyces sp. TRM 70361 TaxID=3116553 RepID=UPI002E7B5C79|nr:copper resistance protein CopC [Streptomyces sp. TRM 70361]MEE1939633.1 copper resistance protein CopC [Streptomyces sp. TRM 70361]